MRKVLKSLLAAVLLVTCLCVNTNRVNAETELLYFGNNPSLCGFWLYKASNLTNPYNGGVKETTWDVNG